MTENLIETVARALCDAIGVPCDDEVFLPVANEFVVAWKDQIPKAKAAILATLDAIREPPKDWFADEKRLWEDRIAALRAEIERAA